MLFKDWFKKNEEDKRRLIDQYPQLQKEALIAQMILGTQLKIGEKPFQRGGQAVHPAFFSMCFLLSELESNEMMKRVVEVYYGLEGLKNSDGLEAIDLWKKVQGDHDRENKI